MPSDLLLHVGFPKTGTKTLQLQFFPNHPDLIYLGRPFDNDAAEEFIDYLKNEEEASYQFDIAKEKFDRLVSPKIEHGKVFAVSDEDLTSYEFADRCIMIRRFQELFDNVKIVVSIRHQLTQLESYYFQALNWQLRPGGVYVPFENFIYDTLPIPRMSPVHNVRYFDLCRAYEKLVGRDSLMIILYEDFKMNNNETVNDICAFAGISKFNLPISPENAENTRHSGRSMSYRKIRKLIAPHVKLSSLVPSALSQKMHSVLSKGQGASVTWSPAMKQELKEFFKEDNQNLADYFDLDLQSHDYPM